MKRKITAILLSLALVLTFTACGTTDDTPTNDTTQGNNVTQGNNDPVQNDNDDDDTDEANDDDGITGAINVISREDGSGTRGAFVELFDVRIENAEGKKVDDTRQDVDIQSSTGQVLSAVQGNKQAMGYISLGSLDDTVKALMINGVEATPENVLSGDYTIARPFNLVMKEDLSEAAQDFIDFIMSDEGQEIIKGDKYISEGSTGAYTMGNVSGTIKVEGSSSVSPVMTKLIEAYTEINSNVKIEIQTNDSSTGVNAAIAGTCDIGMVSRDVRDEEIEQGLNVTAICLDGIAVVVNIANPLNDISQEDVREIYQDGGAITQWEEIS